MQFARKSSIHKITKSRWIRLLWQSPEKRSLQMSRNVSILIPPNPPPNDANIPNCPPNATHPQSTPFRLQRLRPTDRTGQCGSRTTTLCSAKTGCVAEPVDVGLPFDPPNSAALCERTECRRRDAARSAKRPGLARCVAAAQLNRHRTRLGNACT